MWALSKFLLCSFVLLSANPLLTQTDKTSKVLSDNATVYSQSSTKSRVVKRLNLDQPVLVDFMITNSEGSWCEIREPGEAKRAGYVQCTQLSNEALPSSSPEMVSISKAASATEAQRAASSATPTGSGSLGAWGAQLGLTEEQNARLDQLLATSGIISCRDDLAGTFRSYGVTDAKSMLDRMVKWGKNPYGDSFAPVTEPKIKRGARSYKLYWKQVWNTFTPAQREKAARNLNVLFAYLTSQSDPETGFIGYVLSYMKTTAPRSK